MGVWMKRGRMTEMKRKSELNEDRFYYSMCAKELRMFITVTERILLTANSEKETRAVR